MKQVPFHSQKWNLTQWKLLGFTSEEEATYWERSCCGILCLQMAVEYLKEKSYTTRELITKGQELGAYTDVNGWSHQGLVELAKQLGLEAKAGRYTPEQIEQELAAGNLIIVSIKWGFRSEKSVKERILFWKKYGGHLALVIGVEKEGNEIKHFIVHHTSIRKNYNWSSKPIPLAQFKEGYTGRAIILGNSAPLNVVP